MRKLFILLLAFSVSITQTFAQDTSASNNKVELLSATPSGQLSPSPGVAQSSNGTFSPYTTRFWLDAPIIAGGVGLTGLGVSIIQNMDDLTPVELATKTRDKVPSFDRGNVGYYSEKADKDSYIPFHFSFAAPVAMMLLNKNERIKLGQVVVLYIETMAITGSMFTLAAGIAQRPRPLVYTNSDGVSEASYEKRINKNSQRAFYAGHTASSAAAMFFLAKTFQDFNPDSKLKPYIWVVAAAVPAFTGYLRYKAGMHFLSDNVLGYVLGAATGLLVPELHKNKRFRNVTFSPQAGKDYKGLAFNYRF